MTTKSEKVTGGCLCGAIRYESDKPPYQVGYCHCDMCKKNTGSLFGIAAFFNPEHFRYLGDEPAWYASSTSAKRGFCARCGSPIAWQHNESGIFLVWVGSLDSPEKFEPQVHYNLEKRLPWVDIQANLRDATEEGPSRRFGTYAED